MFTGHKNINRVNQIPILPILHRKTQLSILMLSLFVFINLFVGLGELRAGQITLPNDTISAGGTIEIQYVPDGRFKNLNDLYIFLYAFEKQSNSPIAYSFKLNEVSQANKSTTNNNFKASFSLPNNIVYAYFKINEGENIYNYDDNKGNYWDIFFKINTSIAENSFLKHAVSYLGSTPENARRNINLKQAYNSLKQELDNFPYNNEAKIALATLEFDTKKISNDNYKKQLELIVNNSSNIQSEGELRAFSRALNLLGRKNEADKLEQDFVRANPDSKIAEEKKVAELTNATTFKEFSKIGLEYLKQYRNADSYTTVLAAFANSYSQMGKIDDFISLVDSNSYISEEIKLYLINSIIGKKLVKDTELQKAAQIYNSLILNTDNREIKTIYNNKPSYINDIEWANTLKSSKAAFFELGFDLYDKIPNNLEKQKAFIENSLYFLDKNLNSGIVEKAINFYQQNQNYPSFNQINIPDRINNLYKSAILQSVFTDSLILRYKNFLAINNQNLSEKINSYQISSYIDSLSFVAEKTRLDFLKYHKLDGELFLGTIRKLDKTYYDISDFLGEKVVITFTSTWCGPCQLLYPALEKLYLANKDNNKVKIITLDVWEKQSDNKDEILSAMLKQIPVAFPFYIDDSDILPSKYGVTGLPTSIVVDSKGKIQFIERGYSNEPEFLRRINDELKIID